MFYKISAYQKSTLNQTIVSCFVKICLGTTCKRLFIGCIFGYLALGAMCFGAAEMSMDPIKKLGKKWAFISGKQRAVREENRVNYIVNSNNPTGWRVNDFEAQLKLDANDSLFVNYHLNANEVFSDTQMVGGPSFYISKTEVTNAEYRMFVNDCCGVWKGINVAPKTDVWTQDFHYSYNEPMRTQYYIHPAYDNFPVVGIRKDQAEAYCEWYTGKIESERKGSDKFLVFRLPTELEWERAASVTAAKPSKRSSGSPVNNNFLRDHRGCYNANFYAKYGNFGADGAVYCTEVESYLTNDVGCYNMQGNVAEITSTRMPFRVSWHSPQIKQSIQGGIDSDLVFGQDESLKKIAVLEDCYVVKGGAWNLPQAACTVGSRMLIDNRESHAYVGFRMVATTMVIRKTITPQF